MSENVSNDISIIIFVLNEELHIQRCIDQLRNFTSNLFFVDSSSNDKTKAIIEENGFIVENYVAESFSEKINWAINHLPIKTTWTMRLDADEILTSAFKENILSKLSNLNNNIDGVYVNRRHYFLGKWIKHGGMHPKKALRIWRTKRAQCEKRTIDEHMVCISGLTSDANLDIIDNNLNTISSWTIKHNNLSNFESISNTNMDEMNVNLFGSQPERIRWLRNHIYNRTPLFLAPFAYFIYRYFIRLGFLDGKEGLIWHFLHAFWYRFLVDAKKYEMIVTDTKYKLDVNKMYE